MKRKMEINNSNTMDQPRPTVGKKTPRKTVDYFTVDMFKDWEDFKEGASKPDKAVLMGNRGQDLYKYYDDIDLNHSQYIGRVLYPEHRHVDWSFEKNMAFMAGMMSAQRDGLVLTDMSYYANRKHQKTRSFTMIELLILVENGYHFSPNVENKSQTVFRLEKSLDPGAIKITNYKNVDPDLISKKFNKEIVEPLLVKRKLIDAGRTCTFFQNQPNNSSGSEQNRESFVY